MTTGAGGAPLLELPPDAAGCGIGLSSGGMAAGSAGTSAMSPCSGGGPGWRSLPRSPAVGSASAGRLATRGCWPRRGPDCTPRGLWSIVAKRQCPGLRSWSSWKRGRGGIRAQPGQSQVSAGPRCWHCPSTRVCRGSCLLCLPRQPGQSYHHGRGRSAAPLGRASCEGSSPGPLPTSGKTESKGGVASLSGLWSMLSGSVGRETSYRPSPVSKATSSRALTRLHTARKC